MMRVAAAVATAHLALFAALIAADAVNTTRMLPMTLTFEQGSLAAAQGPGSLPPNRSPAPAGPQKQRPLKEVTALANASSDSPATRTAPATVSSESVIPASIAAVSDGLSASGTPVTKAQGADDRQPVVDASFAGNRLPEYPAMSRRLGEQGTVVLRVLIDANGKAGDVQLVRSSGSERLDQSAIQTIRQWRFVPALKGGKPVSAWYEWQWEFRLSS